MANAIEDVATLRSELEVSQKALEALQRNFDDFQDSSRELEEELEAELGRTQDQVSELTSRLAEVAGRLGEQQAKSRELSSEIAVAQAETARLRAAAVRAAAEKTALEQSADELETKCRGAVAAEEDWRHKLDLSIEEKIFVSNDLEDLRAETLRTEQALRSEIEDLRQELGRVNNGTANGIGRTPSLVLPRLLSSHTDSADPTDDTATVVDGDDLRSIGGPQADTADDDGLEDSYPEAADEAADELIKALEEEVEGLKSDLQDAEAANDELNMELQELQEQLLPSNRSEDGAAGGGGVLNGEGAGTVGVGNQLSPGNYEAQVALKEELAEAMAMCEELDQTVTDLTDELHIKDEQRRLLESRVAEVEAELGSRTQLLEDQVSKAKTSATSLAARLADVTAELRASNGRLDDASSKAVVAQKREELLREESASLREQLSERAAAASDLSHAAANREVQLEEALAAAEKLREGQPRLQESVETLSARLVEETAARRLAEQTAAEREADLQKELCKVKAAAVVAAEAVVEAGESSTRETDSGLTGIDSTAPIGGQGDSEQGEGQSSGERPVADEAGAVDNDAAVLPLSVVDAGAGGVPVAAGETSVSERELEEKVARLEAALEEAQKNAERGAGGGNGVGLGGKGSSAASVLESEDLDLLKEELRNTLDLYGRERVSNASLLSKIRALRGNIEVICRIRPPTSEETAAGVPIALEALGEGEVGVKTGRPGGGGGPVGPAWRSFTLDKALGPSTSQEEVFRQVEPLALSAADGMNACIFAYGQTGSGKTHTMIGDAKGGDMAGVSYRTMNKLFQVLELRERQQPGYTFTVKVAMLEIYNEEVRDLLSPSDSSSSASGNGIGIAGGSAAGDGGADGGKLEIRRDQDGMVQVPGLTHVAVSSAEEVLTLLERGGGARAVAATGVHDHSSRSHSVLLAEVSSRSGLDALPATGRLFLVDLAGSERIKVSGVTGAGLREATNINSSLSALGDVMQALDQKQKHVPYRNSKLTFLLQDALGGNSRTAMVVTVCPTSLNVDETLFALQFATRARNVSLGPTHRNVGAKNLMEEGKELRAKLREAARKKEYAEEALSTLQREHARSQQKMGALLEARAKNVGDLRHQMEEQIESLKRQLEASQAATLAERNKRAAVQAEAEDTQRQLKRSLAKVTALGRDREEREAKLRAKQEEVGELKAEVRKVVSEAKNTVRRLSAGRSTSGSGVFGFKAKGGEGDGAAPGRGLTHTPSKKVSEAKYRYTRTRQSTPGSSAPMSAAVTPFTSVSPQPATEPEAVTADGDAQASALPVVSTAPTMALLGREERPVGIGSGTVPSISDAACSESVEETEPWMTNDAAAAAAAASNAAVVALAASAESGSASGETNGVTAEEEASDIGASDDVAAAIARATAVFAKPAPRTAVVVKADIGGGGAACGGKRGSGTKSRSNGGVSSSLMKGTASSTSRLRLNVAATLEENGSVEAPHTGRRSGSTPRAVSTPRDSSRPITASPSSRLARPSSFSSSLATKSNGGSVTNAKTPRTRSSVSGPVGASATAAAAAVAAVAAASCAGRRRMTMHPPSPAHRTGSTPAASTLTASSTRSVAGHTGGKGWLGEKSRLGANGGLSSSATRPSSASSAGRAASAPPGSGTVTEKKADGVPLSRAQIALNRHQARMDRIREKREERKGAKDSSC